MNALLAGVLILTTGGVAEPEAAPLDEAWTSLDREVENLAASLEADEGPRVGLLLRRHRKACFDVGIGDRLQLFM